jgi:hypothetical protein
VVCDALGEDGIGGGGEVDGAACGVLLLQILKEFAVVGEVRDIQGDGGGEMPFKGGFALEEPAGELKQVCGMMAGQGERRVDEGIGLDQGAV